jgi:hypothetical protein
MAVTNPYYEFTPEFIPGTTARAEDVNVQYQAIQTACARVWIWQRLRCHDA